MKKICFVFLLVPTLIGSVVRAENVLKQYPEAFPTFFKSIHQAELESHRYDPPCPIPEVYPVAPLVERSRSMSKEVLGYYPYWVSGYSNLRWDLLSTLAWFCVEANGDGSLGNTHGWPVTGIVNEAHLNGVRVILTVTCFSGSTINSILSSPTNRGNLINNLLDEVEAGFADGVNIDFEGVWGSNRDSLTVFMQELSESFHSQIPGSYVTIATPAVDWSSAFDYNEIALACDGLMVMAYGYFWSGSSTTGPVSPLDGYTWDVTWTVDDYLTKTGGQNDKIIIGIPYYGYDWPCSGPGAGSSTTGSGSAKTFSIAEPLAQTHGKLWHEPSTTPWYAYNSGQWHQCWYDDWTSLGAKYQLFLDEDLRGAGIWALRYDSDRVELWDALDIKFGTIPRDLRIQNQGEGELLVSWAAVQGASSYRVYYSADGLSFDGGTSVGDTIFIKSGLPIGDLNFFKVSSTVSSAESPTTEVLGARSSVLMPEILIVNGFDRAWIGNTRDFIRQHGSSLSNLRIPFDACSNETVVDARVSLSDYKAVDWILGNESTNNESFAWAEQEAVATFLQDGGHLLTSGSEIGWDLESQGNDTDEVFYHDYLRTDYVGDDAGVYNAAGVGGTIFSGLSTLGFDDGSNGTYDVAYPDRVTSIGGSIVCLDYVGTSYHAAVQYIGVVSGGMAPCKIVDVGFPLETVYVESVRDSLFSRVMNFFGIGPEPDVVPPVPVADLTTLGSGSDIVLSWSAVSLDTLGSSESVAYYIVYSFDEPFHAIAGGDSVGGPLAPGWTDVTGLPAAGSDCYYSIEVVDESANRSDFSNRSGVFSFTLP